MTDQRETVQVTFTMSPEYAQQIKQDIIYSPWWMDVAKAYAQSLADYWLIPVTYWSTDKRFKQTVNPKEQT